MTRQQFEAMPLLLAEKTVRRLTGYSRAQLRKMTECGVLQEVQPRGCGQARYRKRQVANLLNREAWMGPDMGQIAPQLMTLTEVQRWTGYDRRTLREMEKAGAIAAVRPAGDGVRYRLPDVQALVYGEDAERKPA